MKSIHVNSYTEFLDGVRSSEKAFLLLYKKGNEQSDCAFERIQSLDPGTNASVFLADVNVVRDIHVAYNIRTAPSLLEFEKGKLKNIYKGCQSEQFYNSALSGKGFTSITTPEGKKAKRVIVYTTPTCTWCNTIKTYLGENGIHYTEVDVASNPSKAEEMVRKSGQQGVPQTDIDGQIVVGFDRKRINELLEIN